MAERVAVVGLGYVGLPVAIGFGAHLPDTVGFDIDASRVDELKKGHDRTAEFSDELFGAREGEVVEVLFVNHHAHIFFVVKNEAGEEELWDVQSSTPQNLLRRGWGPDTIKIGDRIIVEGNLGLENSNKLWAVTITQESGEVIYASGGDN